MAAVYLASYKSVHKSLHGLVNIAIRALDNGPYSHTEIVLGDPFDGAPVDSLSSSGLDGGVRIKPIAFDPARWDFVPLPWVQEADARALGKDLNGCGYDYWGVTRFALPWAVREHPRRVFCSEIAAMVMGLQEPWRVSPNGLHAIAISLARMTGGEA